MPPSSKRKSIVIRVPTSPKHQPSRQATEEKNDNKMSSPANNSIVVGGPRRPARRSNATHIPDSEDSDAEMEGASCASTIDQPIDTRVTAKNATAFNPAPDSVPMIADTPAPTVNNNNQTNGTDDKSLALIQPQALPVHPKPAPGPIAKAPAPQNLTLEELTMRQMQEDIEAYEMDLNFCASLLDDNLTPQETRTIRIRQMDLQHQIRTCRHRLELLTAKAAPARGPGRPPKSLAAAASLAALSYLPAQPQTNGGPSGAAAANTNGHPTTATGDSPGPKSKPTGGTKRASLHPGTDSDADADMSDGDPPAMQPPAKKARKSKDGPKRTAITAAAPPDPGAGPSEFQDYNTVDRLGYWICRLCQAPKYLTAGAGRTPGTPCKWPLRDTSKLVNHHVTLHGEHTKAERYAELAVALDHNRGPLEYWLTSTKSFNIGDGTVINEIIDELKAGRVHPVLRQLNRAAREADQ
ncbi:hypothetical protein QBC39DRAFT_356814 [Podospora conica]|nr:hypothetical protein QBC39DRAFT_356814 [Schizothecium conicum]